MHTAWTALCTLLARTLPLSSCPATAFAQAVRTHRLDTWVRRWPAYTPATSAEKDTILGVAPQMRTTHLHNLRHHPVRTTFYGHNMLALALRAKDAALIQALDGDAWATHADLDQALFAIRHAPLGTTPAVRHNTSALLSAIIDAHIARGEWHAYGQALASALRLGLVGLVPWAIRQGHPILDCLPVREHMFEVYHSGASDASFRLAAFLGSGPSAHQRLALYAILPLAGDLPSDVLFAPQPEFLTACQELPLLAGIRPGRCTTPPGPPSKDPQ